jgi:hypothetical protein
VQGVGNSTNTPPYVSWISTAASPTIYLQPGGVYNSPPFHVRDAEDLATLGLVSISSIEARSANVLPSVTFSRTAFDPNTLLPTYEFRIEAAADIISGRSEMYMNITDVLSTVTEVFNVVVEEAPVLTRLNYNGSAVEVVHGQRSPPIYFSVTSALGVSFDVSSTGDMIKVSEATSLGSNTYSLEFTASEVPSTYVGAVVITATSAVGSTNLTIPSTITNLEPFFSPLATYAFVVDRHQEVTTPVVQLQDSDDDITSSPSAAIGTAQSPVITCRVALRLTYMHGVLQSRRRLDRLPNGCGQPKPERRPVQNPLRGKLHR